MREAGGTVAEIYGDAAASNVASSGSSRWVEVDRRTCPAVCCGGATWHGWYRSTGPTTRPPSKKVHKLFHESVHEHASYWELVKLGYNATRAL